jgi:protein-S-isoprenylcysteine O-methyltransferase Ste14
MDLVYRSLVPAVWLIWLAYWLIASFGTKAPERVESPRSHLIHTVPLGIAAWMIFAPHLPHGFLGGAIVPQSPALYLAGVGVLVLGLAFAIWARVRLGSNWSGTVELKRDHELVRGGPYRFVRHPIYTGILIGFVGSAIARDEWRAVAALPLAVLALWRKLSVEERWMLERFGDAYRRFQAEVPALIPNPFRRARAPSP